MRAVLPGKPRATPQAVCTARWNDKQIIIYISGNSIVILDSPESLFQTICQDEVEALDAVAVDTVTGKFAASSGGQIYIYEPYGLEEYTKWSQQCSFVAFDGTVPGPCTLSWGMPGELLVGSTGLRLYHIGRSEDLIWDSTLPSSALQALFSPDADLIASFASCDPLVKVWRRLSGGYEHNTFDFCYLPHPAPVTEMFWRKPEKRVSQGGQHVLYTLCADNRLRVWAQIDHHSMQTLELWGELDLTDVIQPRHLKPESQSDERSVFVIPGDNFDAITKSALKVDVEPNKRPFLEHLSEIASQRPDICVVLDNKGHMSAWGLQNIGSKRRKDSDIFNIALVENFNLFGSAFQSSPASDTHTKLTSFLKDPMTPSFSTLVHYFDGSISWMDGRVDEYFDPAPNPKRLRSQALWTSHDQPIEKMVRNASGLALISRSEQGEALVWQSRSPGQPTSLHRASGFDFEGAVLGLCVLDRGNYFVSLQSGKVCLWESETPTAKQVACCSLNVLEDPVCILRIPSGAGDTNHRFVAVLTAKFEGVVYEIDLPSSPNSSDNPNGVRLCSISQLCTIKSQGTTKYSSISAVDPVGSHSTMPNFLDTFAPDVALATTNDGRIETFAARLDVSERSLSWLKTAKIDTGLPNTSISVASSSRKVAVADEDGTGLLVWDTKNGDLEFEQSFGVGETIRDLDWTATPDSQSLLAVGFPHKVVVFGQMRYNYLRPEPAWAAIREIYIRDLTPHPIGDSTWLSGGNLIIGAGRQLFVYDDAISGQDKTVKDIPVATHVTSPGRLFTRVNLLNGPLPLFHPQFLTQAVLAGKLALVQHIIVRLHKSLKFYTEGEELDMKLGIPDDELFGDGTGEELDTSKPRTASKVNGFDDDNSSEPETVTEELASALNEKLVKTSLPYMSSQDQFYLSNLVDSIALTEKQRRSVDDNAARFITFFRQFMLIKASEHQFKAGISWREYSWAFHSDSQDILVDLVSKQYNGKMLWTHAKEAGIFMWMKDLTALRAHFEIIARNEYSKTDDRNPVDCSLFYLALKKKNVLLGLWRMAGWNKEQAGTQRLLANNFAEPRWKTAALKNAYALLGKRRFEYAAAFFLLADHLQDAVNVCVNQMKDLQLGIAVARVYDGDESPVFRQLLEERVLPEAAQVGDRWRACWAFWMLGHRDRAVRALITPIWTLVDSTMSPTTQAQSFLANDPALLAMYAQFRERSLQALKGATQVSPQEEWDFVLRTARLYARMGCDYLALDLVRNWSFLKTPKPAARGKENGVPDPRQLLRRRSSLVVDDMAAPKSPTLGKKLGAPKPPPTMFEEPAASSLLDQFGF